MADRIIRRIPFDMKLVNEMLSPSTSYKRALKEIDACKKSMKKSPIMKQLYNILS